jgi:hypothetical protein
MIGNLFFNRNMNPGGQKIDSDLPSEGAASSVRIFCKQDLIDDSAVLTGNIGNAAGEIENYRILSIISGKKVFLRVKALKTMPGAGGKILEIPYRSVHAESGHETNGSLFLSENNIRNVFKIIGHPIDGLEDFIDEVHIRALEKIIFRKISGPPPDFSDAIVNLPDKNLQLLLNHILHKNIASIDMLASYIYGLGECGQRMTDNLSRSVRAQVIEKVKLARLKSTYRWAGEVRYIIHRNLFAAARELGISIKGIEALDFISKSYEIAIAKNMLQSKSITGWLTDFDRDSKIGFLLSNISRKYLSRALTFAGWSDVGEIFKKYISREGVELLRQDVEFSRSLPDENRFESLEKFYRKVKDIEFTPLVAGMNFEKEVKEKISGEGQVDLIVDEIGFARTVFALKNMPFEWIKSIMPGPLLAIYEDVLGKRIKISRYEDYRISECRRDFLKALLILAGEDKI